MPFYVKHGQMPPKRHTVLRKPDGGIYYEELIGNKGFTGISSILYRINRPTEITNIQPLKDLQWEAHGDSRLRPRHLRLLGLPEGGSPTLDRTPVMFNGDVGILFSRPTVQDEHFYRNGQADEILYVADGEGTLETPLGFLPYRRGDYVVIPRGIAYRMRMKENAPHNLLITESRGEVRTPSRYRNEHGQLVEGAPFSERDIVVPEDLHTFDETGEFKVVVKQYEALHEITVKNHPFDVVGWDGYFYPWTFNIENFEPIVGRIHQPPPIHQTFQGDGFVVCSFCPRPYDFDDNAVPAPYHHSNVMSDEVLFYASKDFMSRKGVEYGSVTLHPDGLPHGPHPGKAEASIGKTYTDELAVMIDTFRPLHVAKSAAVVEDEQYYQSWLETTA